MSIKILLVDDNVLDARLFQELLNEMIMDLALDTKFFHTTSLNNINDLLIEKKPDLVFLDLGLKESSGLDTIHAFKKVNSEIALVAYTGINDVQLGSSLLELGVDDYICKNDATSSVLAKTILLNIKRKELKEELKETNHIMLTQARSAAMGSMIGMIAHQWRQPLTTLSMIKNNMEIDIEMNNLNADEFKKNLNSFGKQIHFLSKTIDDFRNFFEPKIEKTHISLTKVIRDTIELINPSFKNNTINIELNLEETEEIKIFSNELSHVILNILNNSKDAFISENIENRNVLVKLYKKENQFFIEIEDNAGGISSNIIDKIFDPYFTTKEKQNGTGIGLYMSKTIIEKHFNGKIIAENIDNGVKFIISFVDIIH